MAFPREGNLNFPWEKSHWDRTVVKKKKKSKGKVSAEAVLKEGWWFIRVVSWVSRQ